MRARWPDYAIEAVGLATFMVVACALGTLLGHPGSPVFRMLPDAVTRRVVMGAAMGLTAVALIYSPWGRRSGAHFNPATTLTFWRLGTIETRDAVAYAIAQVGGGLLGVLAASAVLGAVLAHPDVRYVATVPGGGGPAVAFAAEIAMAFVLMSAVLHFANDAALARFTGLAAGTLVALFITVEAPLSGMSLNPARSLASAVPANAWDAFWIYLVAPPLGMVAAAEIYVHRYGARAIYCAKLQHDGGPCRFRCRWGELRSAAASRAARRVSQAHTAR